MAMNRSPSISDMNFPEDVIRLNGLRSLLAPFLLSLSVIESLPSSSGEMPRDRGRELLRQIHELEVASAR